MHSLIATLSCVAVTALAIPLVDFQAAAIAAAHAGIPSRPGVTASLGLTESTRLIARDDALPTTINEDLSPLDAIYAGLSLQHHNIHRANHSAPALTWNATLAWWAEEKANKCNWDESLPEDAYDVGMNIAQGTDSLSGDIAETISNLWYNNEMQNFPQYNSNNEDLSNFENWGHFSQVVWKSTTQVGCYTTVTSCTNSDGSDAGYFTACMYYPPGNYLGEFMQVGTPLGHPTLAVVNGVVEGLPRINSK